MQSAYRLQSLNLEGFRVYQNLSLALDKDLTLLIGENGIGKTSILEAIAMAGNLRSFRRAADKDMISAASKFYGVTLSYQLLDKTETLRFAYGQDFDGGISRRSMTINNQKVGSVNEFLGRFKVVVFSPDDTDIIDRSPKERRQFFDSLLCTLYPGYLKSLQSYNRVLLQRNIALKKNANLDEILLLSFDRELAIHGVEISQRRKELCGSFAEFFNQNVEAISDSKDSWNIEYHDSVQGADSTQAYLDGLQQVRANDRRLKQTTKGIHRDRFYFYPGNGPRLELQQFASQGQKRTVALALKMAQYQLILSQTNCRPVLLIDDVLNELDLNRREKFLSFLSGIGQAIITTTELKGLESFLEELSTLKSSQVYEITKDENGPLVNSALPA